MAKHECDECGATICSVCVECQDMALTDDDKWMCYKHCDNFANDGCSEVAVRKEHDIMPEEVPKAEAEGVLWESAWQADPKWNIIGHYATAHDAELIAADNCDKFQECNPGAYGYSWMGLPSGKTPEEELADCCD